MRAPWLADGDDDAGAGVAAGSAVGEPAVVNAGALTDTPEKPADTSAVVSVDVMAAPLMAACIVDAVR
jgi:hypothetical protein